MPRVKILLWVGLFSGVCRLGQVRQVCSGAAVDRSVFMKASSWLEVRSRSHAVLPVRQLRERLGAETLHAFRMVLASSAHDESSALGSSCERLISVSVCCVNWVNTCVVLIVLSVGW